MVAVVTFAAACGARLDDDLRARAARAALDADDPDGAATEEGPFAPGDGGGPDATPTPDGSTGGDLPAPDAPGGAGGDGGEASPDATQPPAGREQRRAPPPAGGNGGATDVGVTGNALTLAVIADRSGPIPGLFESSVRAMNAWASMVNAEGGLHGRQIRILPLDSRTDASAHRAATLQACEQAFALVGSMSAFDNGGAEAGARCGIPDISAITISAAHTDADNSYPAFPAGDGRVGLGSALYVRDNFPQGVRQNAALLYSQGTEESANRRRAAYESVGFRFTYVQEVSPVEPNYQPFVIQMRSRGIRFVTMISEVSNIARLNQAFRQQDFQPEVRQFDSAVYTPRFHELAGEAVNGALVFLNFTPFSEAGSNRELALYLQWLERTRGGTPDLFGLYAWSAGRLFQDVHDKVGPKLTRRAVLEQLRKYGRWDGHGMHGYMVIGAKRQGPCNMNLRVQGGGYGGFRRIAPPRGLDCSKPMFDG